MFLGFSLCTLSGWNDVAELIEMGDEFGAEETVEILAFGGTLEEPTNVSGGSTTRTGRRDVASAKVPPVWLRSQ